eukprot:2132996-Alexandrium_andersonii.AAC.1
MTSLHPPSTLPGTATTEPMPPLIVIRASPLATLWVISSTLNLGPPPSTPWPPNCHNKAVAFRYPSFHPSPLSPPPQPLTTHTRHTPDLHID